MFPDASQNQACKQAFVRIQSYWTQGEDDKSECEYPTLET